MLGSAIGLGLWLFRQLQETANAVPQLPASKGRPALLSDKTRRRHAAVFGQSGAGKSRFLESLIILDALRRVTGQSRRGVAMIEVHGDLYGNSRSRLALMALRYPVLDELVVLIDPTFSDWTVQYNPLELRPGDVPERRATMLARTFTTVYHDDPTTVVRLFRVMYHAFLTLLLAGLTLLELPLLLRDKHYREAVVSAVDHPEVHAYWLLEFPRDPEDGMVRVESTLNRLGRFVSDPDIAALLRGPSTINFRELMDRGAIVLVNAAKGRIGEDNAYLLCAFILAEIQQAALGREAVPERERTPFSLVCDEFANYTTDTIRQIIAEDRKFGLELWLAAQEVRGQLKTEALQSAVLNTVGSTFAFRLGYEDADTLVKDMFTPDLYQIKATVPRWQKPFGVDIETEQPVFRSLEEIWELERRKLTQLADQMVWWKQRGQPGTHLIKPLYVADIEALPEAHLVPEALQRQEAAARQLAGRVKRRVERTVRPVRVQPRTANRSIPALDEE